MNYTISVAWVIDLEPDQLETLTDDDLHRDIVQGARATAALLRQKYPARELRCMMSEIMIPMDEKEIAPAQK